MPAAEPPGGLSRTGEISTLRTPILVFPQFFVRQAGLLTVLAVLLCLGARHDEPSGAWWRTDL
jgi:hypothetical protein